MTASLQIGQSEIQRHGSVEQALRINAGTEIVADILIAHLHMSNPNEAERLASALG